MGCKCTKGKAVTLVRCLGVWGRLCGLLTLVWMMHACFLHLSRGDCKWVGERDATLNWTRCQALCHSSFVCYIPVSSAGAKSKVPGTMWGGTRSKTLGTGGEVASDKGQGMDSVGRHHYQERGGKRGEDQVKHGS